MKRMWNRAWLVYLLLAVVVLVAAACGGAPAPTSAPKGDTGTKPAATQSAAPGSAATPAPAPKGRVPSFISIGTAPTGASMYPLGVAIAGIITDKLGIKANAEVTGASIENITLISKGQAELGWAMADTAYQALNGLEAFKDKPVPILRALMLGYSAPYILVVRADAGIQEFKDIKGKRIAANMPRASSNRLAMTAALEANEMKWDDVKQVDIVSLEEVMAKVKDGTLDGVWYPVAPGNASYRDLVQSVKTHWVSLDQKTVNYVLGKYPYFSAVSVPKTANQGQDQDLTSFGVTVLLMTAADLDEGIAYGITKAVLENTDRLAQAHPSGKDFNLQSAASLKGVPYHPGSLRYFQEKGVLKP